MYVNIITYCNNNITKGLAFNYNSVSILISYLTIISDEKLDNNNFRYKLYRQFKYQ